MSPDLLPILGANPVMGVKIRKIPATESNLRPGFLYVAKGPNPLFSKIGFTIDVGRRRLSLRQASGPNVDILFSTEGTMFHEQIAHQVLMDVGYTCHNEWFEMSNQDAIDHVIRLCAMRPILLKDMYENNLILPFR